jgi:hypothetical protein
MKRTAGAEQRPDRLTRLPASPPDLLRAVATLSYGQIGKAFVSWTGWKARPWGLK